MEEIVASVKRVTDIMAEITAAGREQEAGIGQINQAITEMDSVTQQNAALVEESAAAAASLDDQAGHLTQVVGVFKLDGGRTQSLAFNPVRAAPTAQFSGARKAASIVSMRQKPSEVELAAVRSAPARAAVRMPSSTNEQWEEF